MLARLAALEGVLAAEVDHRGELLRLSLAETAALGRVRAALHELGYGSELVDDVARLGDTRWYGPSTVRELSREEARVIAMRITPPFASTRGLAPAQAGRVQDAVAQALFTCFTQHTIGPGAAPGALRGACSSAVEEAIRDLAGPEAARDLVAAMWADLEARDERDSPP